jgi:hypothetical protein
MSKAESKRAIEHALRAFAAQPRKAAATGLFNALGYASKKTFDLKPNGLESFCAMFDPDGRLNRKQALGWDWLESELVFQFVAVDYSVAVQNSLPLSGGAGGHRRHRVIPRFRAAAQGPALHSYAIRWHRARNHQVVADAGNAAVPTWRQFDTGSRQSHIRQAGRGA